MTVNRHVYTPNVCNLLQNYVRIIHKFVLPMISIDGVMKLTIRYKMGTIRILKHNIIIIWATVLSCKNAMPSNLIRGKTPCYMQ